MTSVFSWQNSVSLWPASFCTPRPNLPVTPGISRLPTFAKQIFGGHKQNLVCARIQEKGAVTPWETDPDLCMSVQEALAELWVGGDLQQGWRHSVQQCRAPLSSLPPPWSGLRSNTREGTQPRPSIENWIKDLLSMAPPIGTRPSFPLVSLSYQEASISLLSFSTRGQTEWKP